MADRIYQATGQVIDSKSSEGLAGLTVEVWDVVSTTGKPLLTTQTENDGRFKAELDLDRQRLNDIPDVIFKVLRDGVLLEAEESGVSWNANTEEDVTILVRSIPKNREEAKNRISTQQFLKAVDFVQQSDFKGLFANVKEKVGTRWGVLADVVSNTFTNFDVEPIAPKRNLEQESLNKDVSTAKRNLESEHIVVNVIPYNPRLNKATLTDLTSFATNVKAGQTVNLYEENGIVKYMSVVKENKDAKITTTGADSGKDEIEKINNELKSAREDSLRKDEVINKLQQELLTIKKEHGEINQILKSKDFEALLKSVSKKG